MSHYSLLWHFSTVTPTLGNEDILLVSPQNINNLLVGNAEIYLNGMERSFIFINKRHGEHKYLLKVPLEFVLCNYKKIIVLTKIGLLGLIICEHFQSDENIPHEILELSEHLDFWFDSNVLNREIDISTLHPIFCGISSKFDVDYTWTIIAKKVISQLKLKLFIYSVNEYDIRKRLFYWVDYMDGNLWPSVYHSSNVNRQDG